MHSIDSRVLAREQTIICQIKSFFQKQRLFSKITSAYLYNTNDIFVLLHLHV